VFPEVLPAVAQVNKAMKAVGKSVSATLRSAYRKDTREVRADI